MTDWQPIETAPKDGTDVLLWARTHGVGIGFFLIGDWWVEGGQVTMRPTHWMLLPEPPAL